MKAPGAPLQCLQVLSPKGDTNFLRNSGALLHCALMAAQRDWYPREGRQETMPAAARQILVQGGNLVRGREDGRPDEAPRHEVIIRDFWLVGTHPGCVVPASVLGRDRGPRVVHAARRAGGHGELRRCRCILHVSRRPVAHRGGMGVRHARRQHVDALSVGRSTDPRRSLRPQARDDQEIEIIVRDVTTQRSARRSRTKRSSFAAFPSWK